MKKLVLSGLVFGSLAMAETAYNFLPYGGIINYTGTTTKDNGRVAGIYFSGTEFPWKTEIDLEHTVISYKSVKDTTTGQTTKEADLKQSDLTALFHYYDGYNLAYKFGIHHIISTDDLTDGGNVFMTGILYYKTLKYNYGMDIYYSNYTNETISPKLIQFTPKVGYNFGKYYSEFGSFYVEAKIDYIDVLKNKDENDLKSSYTSTEFTLNNYNGAFTTTMGLWSGKRSYAIENGGFIVNNIGDEQTGGFKASENYKLNLVSSIKAEYSYTKFEDNGDSYSRVYSLSYSYSF